MKGILAMRILDATIAAASGDYELYEICQTGGLNATRPPVEMIALMVANRTDVGETEEEMVALTIRRMEGGTFTAGNGTLQSKTGRGLFPNEDVDGFPGMRIVSSTIASTTGTDVLLHACTFNIRLGLFILWPPDQRFIHRQNGNEAILIRIPTALADDAIFNATLYLAFAHTDGGEGL